MAVDEANLRKQANAFAQRENRGHIKTAKHEAPDDDSLLPGEVSFWFDQTNGAAKPMFKGKQADGTVVTGSMDAGGGGGGSESEVTLTMHFTETAGAGTYTAEVEAPARFQPTWVGVRVDAPWDADEALIEIDNGLWTGSNDIKSTGNYPIGRASNLEVGGYGDWGLPYFTTPTTITGVITTTGTGGTTGRCTVNIYGTIEPEEPTAEAVKS